MPVAPPRTPDELISRATALAGRSLSVIAKAHTTQVPDDLRRNKGWIGQLLERALGATGTSRADHDFPGLGIELKSLPIHADGRVREATYVCTCPLDGSMARRWEDSWAAAKLSRVLWIPVVGDGAPGDRIVGAPLMWSPTQVESETLRNDYAEITDLIALGEVDALTSRVGTALHVRPKAASGSPEAWVLDTHAEWTRTVHRGFYLRPRFTEALLRRAFLIL